MLLCIKLLVPHFVFFCMSMSNQILVRLWTVAFFSHLQHQNIIWECFYGIFLALLEQKTLEMFRCQQNFFYRVNKICYRLNRCGLLWDLGVWQVSFYKVLKINRKYGLCWKIFNITHLIEELFCLVCNLMSVW